MRNQFATFQEFLFHSSTFLKAPHAFDCCNYRFMMRSMMSITSHADLSAKPVRIIRSQWQLSKHSINKDLLLSKRRNFSRLINLENKLEKHRSIGYDKSRKRDSKVEQENSQSEHKIMSREPASLIRFLGNYVARLMF